MKPLKDRLLEKAIVVESGCWIWRGTVNGAGYGTIGLGTKEQGKGFAHRVSYEIHKGPIPEGMSICHKCDVKLCINPDHLFPGTALDNINDAKSKDRLRAGDRWATPARIAGICKGENHGHAKLTGDDVREIRHQFSGGVVSKATLARRFGVSRAMIRFIVNRKNWTHVA